MINDMITIRSNLIVSMSSNWIVLIGRNVLKALKAQITP